MQKVNCIKSTALFRMIAEPNQPNDQNDDLIEMDWLKLTIYDIESESLTYENDARLGVILGWCLNFGQFWGSLSL